MEEGATSDEFIVSGRGLLHLGILLETMRREGYELSVGKPRVVIKEIKASSTSRSNGSWWTRRTPRWGR